jgi:hypothetical protein
MKLSVKILVTVPKPEHFNACTLCFDSLRVGFPTAHISVDINPPTGDLRIDTTARVAQKAIDAGCAWHLLPEKVHLADWISRQVEQADDQLVILDADTVFWQPCEGWEFPGDTLLAGYYVPRIWNDFAQCVSVPRIHTSFMFFPNPSGLRRRIKEVYPWTYREAGEYCPCNPFMTDIKFIEGKPVFWDCCANLYGMLTSTELQAYAFGAEHLACYDHINSASFYDVMLDRLDGDKEGFAYIHRFATNAPNSLRNLWPNVNAYYYQKSLQADGVKV